MKNLVLDFGERNLWGTPASLSSCLSSRWKVFPSSASDLEDDSCEEDVVNTPEKAKTADEKKKNNLISDDVELPDRHQYLHNKGLTY